MLRALTLLLAFVILLIGNETQGQCNGEWAVQAGGNNGDEGVGLASDSQGNIYVTGRFRNNATFGLLSANSNGLDDAFIAKYTNTGTALWVRNGGGNNEDQAECVAVDDDNNAYMAGYFRLNADFDSLSLSNSINNGSTDVFVTRYNTNGQIQWARSAGGSQDDYCMGMAVRSGHLYLTGSFRDVAEFGTELVTSEGESDAFLAHYDTDGNVVWVRSMGGAMFDSGSDVIIDNSGDIYVTGKFMGVMHFGAGDSLVSEGSSDIFLAKYSDSGNLIWAKRAGGISADMSSALEIDDDNIYLSGSFTQTAFFGNNSVVSNGSFDAFLAKYDDNGSNIWVRGAGGNSADYASSITLAVDGSEVYTTGYYTDNIDFDGNTIIGQGEEVFVAMYDKNGQFNFAKSGGGTNNEQGAALTSDGFNNIYATGCFAGSVQFDNSSLSASTQKEIFLWKVCGLGVGVNETATLPTIKAYPNPVVDVLNLTLEGIDGECLIEVHNAMGAKVYVQTFSNYTSALALDLSHLRSGVYYLSLVVGESTYYSKIMKGTR